MAEFKTLKGSTTEERMLSADSQIETLTRKLEALQQAQAGGTDATPRRRDARLEALEGAVAALMKHLGVEAQTNTTAVDLVPAGEG